MATTGSLLASRYQLPKIATLEVEPLSSWQPSASMILTCFLMLVAGLAMAAQRGLLARLYGATYTDLAAAGTAKAERQRLAFVYHHVAAVLFVALIIGSWALWQRLSLGLAATDLTSQMPWGAWVAFYIYFVGLSAGAFLLSSLVYVFGMMQFERIGRMALLSAIVSDRLRTIREQLGATYGVRVSYSGVGPGALHVSAGLDPARAAEAARAVMAALALREAYARRGVATGEPRAAAPRGRRAAARRRAPARRCSRFRSARRVHRGRASRRDAHG